VNKPSVGDFVVVCDRWGSADVRQVTKIGASVYYYVNNRQRRGSLSDVIFSGQEANARLLSERLKSSRAQYDDDCDKAGIRRQKRDAEFIERASAVSSRHQGGE